MWRTDCIQLFRKLVRLSMYWTHQALKFRTVPRSHFGSLLQGRVGWSPRCPPAVGRVAFDLLPTASWLDLSQRFKHQNCRSCCRWIRKSCLWMILRTVLLMREAPSSSMNLYQFPIWKMRRPKTLLTKWWDWRQMFLQQVAAWTPPKVLRWQLEKLVMQRRLGPTQGTGASAEKTIWRWFLGPLVCKDQFKRPRKRVSRKIGDIQKWRWATAMRLTSSCWGICQGGGVCRKGRHGCWVWSPSSWER